MSNPVSIEAPLVQEFPKEGPMDRVIRFMEVNLKEHRLYPKKGILDILNSCLLFYSNFDK